MKILLILCAVFMLGCVKSQTTSIPPPTQIPKQENAIAFLSMRENPLSDDYSEYVGEVQNISNTPLDQVKAVITFYDKAGKVVTSENAYIDFAPLQPGQKSPFKITTRKNPASKKYTLTFMGDGGEIKTIDRTG